MGRLEVDNVDAFLAFDFGAEHEEPVRLMEEAGVRERHLVAVESRKLSRVIRVVRDKVNDCPGGLSIKWPVEHLQLIVAGMAQKLLSAPKVHETFEVF